ncbi:MAG TPA: hypothetical protein VHX11_01820 [Acidobacteriaceae bacterium]|jgi:hypothetical protein|nr:hypothetical protein [Acidobacteriaceae bacterium]
MATVTEKPVTTSPELPKELEDLIDKQIDSMSLGELRAWKRDSAKIMKAAKRRSDARTAAHETSQLRVEAHHQ